MEKKDIVKKYLLKRKIEEFFSKNPTATSVIIEAAISGPVKTAWKVEVKNKQYKITEVQTIKEEYVFEAPEDEPKKKDEDPRTQGPANPQQAQNQNQSGNDDQNNGQEKSEPEEMLPVERTDEEMVLMQGLKGQTIREADIDLNASGGTLTLALVSVENPIQLIWNNEGRVVFNFKGRPYTLKK